MQSVMAPEGLTKECDTWQTNPAEKIQSRPLSQRRLTTLIDLLDPATNRPMIFRLK